MSLVASARAVRPGETVTVTVATSAPGRPTLYVRATGEAWRSTPLDGGPDGRSVHTIPNVRAPLFVYAALGGAVSDTVRVAIIEPGVVVTPIFSKARRFADPASPYFEHVRRLLLLYQKQMPHAAQPADAARVIYS